MACLPGSEGASVPTFELTQRSDLTPNERNTHSDRCTRHKYVQATRSLFLYWPPRAASSRNVAAVYNQAGYDYVAYADGDPERLFCFDGLHGYADRRLWALVEKKLDDLRTAGASSVTILDAGCGPGTWLRRVVTHAHRRGFSKITARGFDVALAQIQAARRLARDLARLPGVNLAFDVADLLDRLPEPDASVDITLCLYSVLSHLPISELPKVAAEFGGNPGAFYHDRALNRQYANCIRRFDQTVQIFQTRPSSGPL